MRTLLPLAMLLLTHPVLAQGAPSWVEDTLYGGAKMNAVVAVVAVIILGIGLWMWRQDRRLTRMEQRLNNPTDQKP